jgi:hypothetical protein
LADGIGDTHVSPGNWGGWATEKPNLCLEPFENNSLYTTDIENPQRDCRLNMETAPLSVLHAADQSPKLRHGGFRSRFTGGDCLLGAVETGEERDIVG